MRKELEKLELIDVDALAEEVEKLLLTVKRIAHSREKGWAKQFKFEPKAGIYAIFKGNDLKYIGETADLKERMGEMHRTYMHSFRRKLGNQEFKAKPVGNKFEEDIERQLDELFAKEITVACLPLKLGRLEVESLLIEKYGSALLNSQSKRNRTNR
jgi:hypothetical protein